MAKPRVVNIIMTECDADKEAAFDIWYSGTHVPMLFKYKGMKKVTRYKVSEANAVKPKFIAVYEFESKEALEKMNDTREFKEAIAEMNGTWKNGGWEMKSATIGLPIKTWER
jgi:hypothetical protein